MDYVFLHITQFFYEYCFAESLILILHTVKFSIPKFGFEIERRLNCKSVDRFYDFLDDVFKLNSVILLFFG